MDKAASRIRLPPLHCNSSPIGFQKDYICNATEAFLLKNMMTSTYNIIKSTLQISIIDF